MKRIYVSVFRIDRIEGRGAYGACYGLLLAKGDGPKYISVIATTKIPSQESLCGICISDNRELLMNLQNKIEEELQGRDIWKSYTEERIREKWSKQLAAVDKNSNYAGVLCVDSRVLLFDHGRMNLCGFFKRFGRTGWKVWKDQCMVGEVEAGTAILLTDHGFLNYCEEELAGCLRPESVGTDLLSDRAERAERRLAELGRKAEQRGGRHMGAVWILPVKGEAIWSKGKQSKETVQME